MSDISDLDDLVEDVKISNQRSSKNDSFSGQGSHGRSKERGNHGTCNFKVSGNLPGTSNFIRPVAQGEEDESVQVTVVSTDLDAKNFEYKSEFFPSKSAKKALDHLGFADFLPVQRVVYPFISKFPSSDFIIKAPAGSGKTFAYLIPIIDQIQRIKEQENSKLINKVAPYAVVVAPTRELVSQLYQETKSYLAGYSSNIRCAVGFGQQEMKNSSGSVADGCDITFLTLGRLKHYFSSGSTPSSIRLDFRNLKYLVLDEAQCFIPDGDKNVGEYNAFGRFFDVLLKHSANSELLQTILVGAELDLKKLALCKQLIRSDHIAIHVVPKVLKGVICEAIEVKQPDHRFLVFLRFVLEFMEEKRNIPQKILIFVNTTVHARRICYALRGNDVQAGALHSELTQEERQTALTEFQDGTLDVLVSTDVISAGMNFPDLDRVILYELPRTEDFQKTFNQRVGRIGRLGNKGHLTFFYNYRVDKVRSPQIRQVFENYGSPIPPFLQPDEEKL